MQSNHFDQFGRAVMVDVSDKQPTLRVVKTPAALLSRALAGVRSATLIINLPGSPKGAQENLEAVWGAISHAVARIQGDTRDCAET